MSARRTWACVAVIGFSLAMAATAAADDVIIPSWRGDPGTTYQQWLFLTDDDPAAPDVVINDYGLPTADISIGWAGSGWWDEFPPTGSGRQGVWDLGRGVDVDHPDMFGGITLTIPNTDITGSSTYKEIWIQITYYVDINDAPTVEVPGATYLGGVTQLVETVPSWGSWYVQQTMWLIEPNPTSEVIIITAHDSGTLVDQIVVDTICVPEPVSVGLVAAGLVAVSYRRRRRSR